MLNTSSLKKEPKEDLEEYGIIKKESALQEGIRKIEEQTNEEVANSFHIKESQIFGSIKEHQENKEDKSVINNFNFTDITKKYSESESYKKMMGDNNQLMITVNEKLNKISVYEKSGKLIGYFTLDHIIKYLADIYDTKKQFMKDLDEKSYNNSKDLIKILIFKLKYNKEINYVDIVLLDFNHSGFMGDIELLIKLNNMLFLYLQNKMNNDLANVNNHNKEKMELNIKKFIFMLLNYTLKLISYTSDQIKEKENMTEIKKYLLEYSIDVVYKINLFVQEQLKIIDRQNKAIKTSLDMNLEIKNNIKSKLENMVKEIKIKEQPPQNIIPQKIIPQKQFQQPMFAQIPPKYQNLINKPNPYSFSEQ